MKQCVNHKGYLVVGLVKKNKITVPIHRLVAKAFIPNPKNMPQVNHKDGNKKNNCVDNLEWCDNEYNMKHAKINGLLDSRTEKNKISIIQLDKNGIFIKKWSSAREVYETLNINDSHIRECCRGSKFRKSAGGFIWRNADENN